MNAWNINRFFLLLQIETDFSPIIALWAYWDLRRGPQLVFLNPFCAAKQLQNLYFLWYLPLFDFSSLSWDLLAALRTVPGEPGIYFLRLHVKLNSMDNREGVVSSIGEKRHGETSNRQGRLPSDLPFNIVISQWHVLQTCIHSHSLVFGRWHRGLGCSWGSVFLGLSFVSWLSGLSTRRAASGYFYLDA